MVAAPFEFGHLADLGKGLSFLQLWEHVCGLAHNNTIMKVNRKKRGPGVIPGSWQSRRIGSTPPMKTAARSKLNLLSAISLSFLLFPVWTWKVTGAKAVTVDGSAARREYLFTVNRGDACSGCGFTQDVLSPPPVWSFLPKKRKKKPDCLRPQLTLGEMLCNMPGLGILC